MTWKDPEKWQAMLSGKDCPFCEDIHLDENEFSYKVVELEHSFIRLPKNQYIKGWLVVALKRHANELYELSDSELAGFWREVALVAKASKVVFNPVKLNYAIYGNLCPHIHCHIFPQYLDNDPHAPIKPDFKEEFLSNKEYKKILLELRREL